MDWQLRRTVENHVNYHVLGPAGVPQPHPEHPGTQQVAEISGRLAAVDDRYLGWADEVGVPVGSIGPEEQDELVAELDACVARLYGLTEDELVHIFETFHVGWAYESRLKTVLDHFHTITWDPAPTEAA